MNVNQMDLLFQMLQAASQAAQATLPSAGSAEETGRSDFQSLLKDKQAESGQNGQTTGKAEENAPAKTEDGQRPENGAQAAEEPAQTPEAEAWKLGLLAYAGQLSFQIETTTEAPAEEPVTQPAQVLPVAEEVQAQPAEETALPVQPEQTAQFQSPVQTEPVQVRPRQTAEAETETTGTADVGQLPASADAEPKVEKVQTAQPQTDTDSQSDGERSEEPQIQTNTWQRPLFSETEHMPMKVGDNALMDTAAPEFDNQLADTLKTAWDGGAQRLELKLSPENLGSVVVELNRNPDGVLHVVIRAESEQAAKLLSDHSSTIGLLLQNSTKSEVRVDVPQPQQSEQQPWQQQQQSDRNGGNSQPQRQNEEKRNTEDFLSQLRLGLLEAEAE